jgi:DNA-binding NarL/FixJ family response regulator
MTDLAEDIGVDVSTLRRQLRYIGLPAQVSPPPMDDDEAAAVRHLYATGYYSKAALGRLFGRGHTAIQTAIDGGPKAPRPNPRQLTPQRKAEITRLYVAGVPIARICRQLGVGETSVYRHVRETGLQQRQIRDRV